MRIASVAVCLLATLQLSSARPVEGLSGALAGGSVNLDRTTGTSAYADGKGSPAGASRPSARIVSNAFAQVGEAEA